MESTDVQLTGKYAIKAPGADSLVLDVVQDSEGLLGGTFTEINTWHITGFALRDGQWVVAYAKEKDRPYSILIRMKDPAGGIIKTNMEAIFFDGTVCTFEQL